MYANVNSLKKSIRKRKVNNIKNDFEIVRVLEVLSDLKDNY